MVDLIGYFRFISLILIPKTFTSNKKWFNIRKKVVKDEKCVCFYFSPKVIFFLMFHFHLHEKIHNKINWCSKETREMKSLKNYDAI